MALLLSAVHLPYLITDFKGALDFLDYLNNELTKRTSLLNECEPRLGKRYR